MHVHVPAQSPSHRGSSMLFRVARLVLAELIAVLFVAACMVAETGRAAPEPSGQHAAGGITYDDETAGHVDSFARVRTIDMCAVHDIAAAERITATTASSLRLIGDLATCDLETRTEVPPARWRFELGFGRRQTTDWARIDIAGAEVLMRPNDAGGCEYLVPTTEAVGLTIRVSHARAAGAGSRPAGSAECDTAERYLAEAVLSRWSDPPALADGLTAPRIPLLGKDPCAALAAGVVDVPDERRRGKTYSMSAPYSCRGARGSAIAAYTVKFEVFSAILDLRGRPVQLGEFTAYSAGGIDAGGCSFQIAVQPELVFSVTEGTAYHGGIVIGLPTCDDTAVAEKVLDNLVRQPDAPPAKADAQLIGDLDGP